MVSPLAVVVVCDTVDILLEAEVVDGAGGAANTGVTEVTSELGTDVLDGKVGVCGMAVSVTIPPEVEEAAGPRAGAGAVEDASTLEGNSVLCGEGEEAALDMPLMEDPGESGDSGPSSTSSPSSSSSSSSTSSASSASSSTGAALGTGDTSRIQIRRFLASRLLLKDVRLYSVLVLL